MTLEERVAQLEKIAANDLAFWRIVYQALMLITTSLAKRLGYRPKSFE